MSALTRRRLRRASAVTGTLAVAVLAGAPGFAAEGSGTDGVTVVNTETVQVYLNASGDIESKRVYEQLALSGHGSVDLKNPVSTSGLRNLDGFGGFDVKNGDQIAKTTVDGTKSYRSVSDYTGTLPVSVRPTYKLDGKRVSPGDVVGKSGHLEVSFEVANKTTKPEEVSFDDGTGKTVTKTADVPVPMVGSLTTSTPKTFTNVDPGGANTAGDGTGGQTLSYNLVLFPPLGSTTTTVGYSADIKDGVVPRVEVAMLPVDPLASPTFKVATEGYQGGATTGAQLVEGATTIDSNLLKLRDGAADLLAGLIKLTDGANQLHTGLADDAAPGAKKLASGTGDALAGANDLKDGLGKISGGLDQLSGQLPGASDGISQLRAGISQLIAGIGPTGDAANPGILDGLGAMEAGLGSAGDATTLIGGLTALKGGLQLLVAPTGLPQAKGGVDLVKSGLDASLAAGGDLDQLVGGLQLVKASFCAGNPVCEGTIDAIVSGINGTGGTRDELTQASGGLGQVSAGLGGAVSQINAQMIPGATQLLGGLTDLLDGVQQLQAGAGQEKAGLKKVQGGLADLADGVAAAVVGATKLSNGAGDAYSGSGKLADGLGQIDTGANDLADGLGTAADGSGQIADGLKTASGGAPQIVDGAGRLSNEGMGQLKTAGKDTAMNYGELYAVIAAGAKRAQTESMAFGAPAGAEGLTAYSFVIRGDDGEGGRNVERALAAAVLLGLGSGAFALRRRLA